MDFLQDFADFAVFERNDFAYFVNLLNLWKCLLDLMSSFYLLKIFVANLLCLFQNRTSKVAHQKSCAKIVPKTCEILHYKT